MTKDSGVMVVAGWEDDFSLTGLTTEMLGLARRLSDELGGPVSAVTFGKNLQSLSQPLYWQGADEVILVEGCNLEPYQADAWLPDLVKVIQDYTPKVVLIEHTVIGMDLAPRLAFRLDTSVAMGCERVAVKGEKILFTRACYGGKVLEEISFANNPSVATVKAKTQTSLMPDYCRTGNLTVVSSSVTDAQIRTRILDRNRVVSEGIRIEHAKVVVAGGGGLGGSEGFEILTELASVLGAALGASRVACDLGWCPPHYQIGLSGKTVAPNLYIAIGISGAGQHMAGCTNAKFIVAINSDADSPIFHCSDFGVVGDYEQLVPALAKEIQKLIT